LRDVRVAACVHNVRGQDKSGQRGGGVLEAVVAPEEVVAGRKRGQARDATRDGRVEFSASGATRTISVV